MGILQYGDYYLTVTLNFMKLHIKSMVSLRCKIVVKDALKNVGLHCKRIDLGIAEVTENIIRAHQYELLKNILAQSGLDLLKDKRAILIERIKNIVIEMVHYSEELPRTKISIHISNTLHYDYTYLANLFSAATGATIEQYILNHKIEKAKELISYDELNLTQISYKLHYSSLAHLSSQFKKITGVTPTTFKKLNTYKERCMLEAI